LLMDRKNAIAHDELHEEAGSPNLIADSPK
jgi:hypothetical protein